MAEKKRKKYKIFQNPDLCKGCGLCYAYCPKGVIEADLLGRAQIAHPENCIGCKKCVWICPDFGIWVEEIDEETVPVGSNNEEKNS